MMPPRILTIGYGNRPLDAFLALLIQHGVAHLVDVRSHPYSRHNPAFRKEPLAEALAACGIRYVFMGDQLGGRPADPACYSGLRVDYDKLRQADFYRAGIDRLHAALAFGQPLALMCAESRPETCHRARLIGETLAASGVEVLHIDETGQLVPHAEVLARLAGGPRPSADSAPV